MLSQIQKQSDELLHSIGNLHTSLLLYKALPLVFHAAIQFINVQFIKIPWFPLRIGGELSAATWPNFKILLETTGGTASVCSHSPKE